MPHHKSSDAPGVLVTEDPHEKIQLTPTPNSLEFMQADKLTTLTLTSRLTSSATQTTQACSKAHDAGLTGGHVDTDHRHHQHALHERNARLAQNICSFTISHLISSGL